MPKYIYNSAEFTPISFKDRIAPYALYVEDYDKQQKDYLDMIEKTGDLDALKDLPMDSEAYGVYSSWKNDIDRLGSIMSTDGLTPEARALALSLKQRQALDIAPLLKKQKIRSDLTKEKRAYLTSHPNAIFDIDVETMPLSDISDSVVPRGYDLSAYSKDWADDIYSEIIKGNDANMEIDYNKYRKPFNYESLSPDKRAKIDQAIASSEAVARAKFILEQQEAARKDRQLDIQEKNANKRTGGSSSSSTSSKNTFVKSVVKNGNVYEVHKTPDGNLYIIRRGKPGTQYGFSDDDLEKDDKGNVKFKNLDGAIDSLEQKIKDASSKGDEINVAE